jgi:hypothetical protein
MLDNLSSSFSFYSLIGLDLLLVLSVAGILFFRRVPRSIVLMLIALYVLMLALAVGGASFASNTKNLAAVTDDVRKASTAWQEDYANLRRDVAELKKIIDDFHGRIVIPRPKVKINRAWFDKTHVNFDLENSGDLSFFQMSGNVRFCTKPDQCAKPKQNRTCENNFICPTDSQLKNRPRQITRGKWVTIPAGYTGDVRGYLVYVDLEYADEAGKRYVTKCTGKPPERKSGNMTSLDFEIDCKETE